MSVFNKHANANVRRITLIKKDKNYLLHKGRYLIGFHDHQLAHYIKNSLPENPETYINVFKGRSSPILINENVYRFDGVKLLLPTNDIKDSDSNGYIIEEVSIDMFIDKPYQYILPYDILHSSLGKTILKCNLIEKYNTV